MNQPGVDVAGVEQHSLARSIALHLLPGALISLFYIVTAPFAATFGFPSGTALFVSIGVVLIPFELGILLSEGRRKNGRFSLAGIVLFREPMPWWQYVALGLPLFMWLGVVFVIFAPPLDSLFIQSFFAWQPFEKSVPDGSISAFFPIYAYIALRGRAVIRVNKFDPPPKTVATIEHVLPKNLATAWAKGFTPTQHDFLVGLLGNLVPLSEMQNKSLQDQRWAEKRKRFKGSNFKTTQAIAAIQQWTPSIIEQRTETLISWIAQTWPELSTI